MKIVRIAGGLGNQMFQYAFAKALEYSTDEKVLLDITLYNDSTASRNGIDFVHNGFELNRVFNIKPAIADVGQIKKMAALPYGLWGRIRRKYFTPKLHFIDRRFCFQPELLVCGNRYYDGYWQTEKYFSEYADKIKKDFTFALALSEQNEKLLLEAGKFPVSVHIRRGDYCSTDAGTICNKNYYNDALEYIFEHAKPTSLLVFSDDIKWCKESAVFLGSVNVPVYYVDWNVKQDSWQDMALMSKCSANIIANSTFSWWGAWLNSSENKVVIAPDPWSKPSNGSYYKYDFSDVVPEKWIKIGID